MQQEILTMSNQQQFLPALTGELISSLGLSDDDLPAIQQLADKIQIGFPATIADFGQNASASSVTLADELLTQVRSSDLDNAGDKLNQVVSIARKVNAGPLSDRRSKVPFIGPFIDKLMLKAADAAGKLDTAKAQIDALMSELDTTQVGLSTRNNVLEEMFKEVKQEHYNLGLYIAAGRVKIQEMQDVAASLQANAGSDQAKVQELADLNDMISKLDKRCGDLVALRHSALQSLPMIRMVQTNNQMLVDKYHTIKAVTVPAWQRQLSLRIALNEQQNAVALSKSIDDTTNQMLLDNAKLLHDNSINTAKSNQRLVIDVDTLASVQNTLIETVQEVQTIQRQGIENRKAAEKQIESLRNGLIANMKGGKPLAHKDAV
ncbi:toxic anion resistance protein (plasmid) [Aeromonas media]|uniref:Toxic anion resistance protein n=1 Tax=Aeromonas media TaxID=651 RepID=A0ABX6NZR1_AERME|nr:toxic anion resistance protein [Aeromonas media]QJT37108.1 toxic anion resistance protein [Aeromonas media]QJT41288.1 toxic anion resistance protein [Aeromonas media]